jgi:MinD superfamily P-loop ATPase
MKEIVVLSGKGGTGKTSVAASLAVLAGKSALIADCDVDAANMHLLLKPDFAESEDFFSGELAVIDNNLCTSCGKCDEVCRFDAVVVSNQNHTIDSFACEGCGYCYIACPQKAISMQTRLAGKLFVSNIRTGSRMVHAKLSIGAENSGKLVAEVKNRAKKLAEQENKKWIIVDGSPGIGCPVVSSLSGASYVLLVTEPTVSGIHDLKRVVEVIQRFRIPAGCLVNKYDLNPLVTSEIIEFAESVGIDILATIPYDTVFSEAMTEQKTVVETNTDSASQLKKIWEQLQNRLK